MEYNIIGDIAGNYTGLMKLLDQMPSTAIPLSLGDMIDRGPQSKEVLDFFMEKGLAILGNHDHFLITVLNKMNGTKEEYLSDYQSHKDYWDCKTQIIAYDIWMSNGGGATLKSFGIEPYKLSFHEAIEDSISKINKVCQQVQIKYRDWLQDLPLFMEIDNLILTHAPIRTTLKKCLNLADINNSVLWNREQPPPIKDKLQLFGHNWYYQEFKRRGSKDPYAICLDGNGTKELIGFHYPSMKIYRQGV
jgi:hypothetical protein